MKNKILIILSVIIIMGLILGTIYLIDIKRMKDNKSVIFSTWGYSYTPPLNEYSSNSTSNEPENSYLETIDNVTIGINIPNSWHYEELTLNEENDFYKYALKLYKSDKSKNAVLYLYHNSFAVCGTGRTNKKMYLHNGDEANIGYYDNSQVWSDISFQQINSNIAFLNYGLEGNEAQEVLNFVKTIKIINNESSTE